MSVDLKFRHGLWSNLAGEAIANGTIYVTTDEKSMYVDLNNERIRIQGTVLYYDSLDDFVAIVNPPYNEDTLYFFRTYNQDVVNALMVWNESTGWKQVNVTADDFSSLSTTVNNLTTTVTQLSASLTSLTTRVSNAEKTIASHGTTLEGHTSAINTNTANIATNTSNIATNASNIAKNKTDIASANTAITNAVKRIDQAEKDIKSNDTDIANLDTRVTANEQKIQENSDNISTNAGNIQTANQNITNLGTRMAAAETAISTHTGQISTHAGDITTLQGKMSTAEGNISELQTQTAGHTSQLNTIEGEIDTIQAKNSDQDSAIGTIQNTIKSLATSQDLQEAFKTANQAIQQNAEDIEANAKEISDLWDEIGTGSSGTSLSGRVTALENADTEIKSDISTIKNSITSINSKNNEQDTKINTNTTDITAIKTKNGEQDTAIAKNAEDIGGLDTRLTSAEGTIGTHTSQINTLNNSVKNITDNYATKKELTDTTTELRNDLTTQINDHILGANAMTYKGTIESKDDLPSSDVAVGDTWIASKTNADTNVAAGDFFVATGTETNGVITSNLKWNQVKSGYDSSLNPKLITEANVIKLQTYAGNNLGAVTIGSNSSNLVVETEGTSPGARTISVKMVWDTF